MMAIMAQQQQRCCCRHARAVTTPSCWVVLAALSLFQPSVMASNFMTSTIVRLQIGCLATVAHTVHAGTAY